MCWLVCLSELQTHSGEGSFPPFIEEVYTQSMAGMDSDPFSGLLSAGQILAVCALFTCGGLAS